MKKYWIAFTITAWMISCSSGRSIRLEPKFPKLTTIPLKMAITAVVSLDNEKTLNPIPDTLVVVIPKANDSKGYLSMTDTLINPGFVLNPKPLEIHPVIPLQPISPPIRVLPQVRIPTVYHVQPETTIFNIDFGRLVCTESPGAIILSPEGGCMSIGGVMHPVESAKPGKLFIKGGRNFANSVYRLSFPEKVTLKQKNGKAEMFAQFFTPSICLYKLDSLGEQIMTIGAMLTTIPNQPSGQYLGELNMKLFYYKDKVLIYKNEE
jgi:hypothetical protein